MKFPKDINSYCIETKMFYDSRLIDPGITMSLGVFGPFGEAMPVEKKPRPTHISVENGINAYEEKIEYFIRIDGTHCEPPRDWIETGKKTKGFVTTNDDGQKRTYYFTPKIHRMSTKQLRLKNEKQN